MSVERSPSSQYHHERVRVVRPEDILTTAQAELLQKADAGLLVCPACGQSLRAMMAIAPEPDLYADVLIFCVDRSCGYFEY